MSEATALKDLRDALARAERAEADRDAAQIWGQKMEAENARLREALDWIEAEPEDPEKVQARARAALTEEGEK